MGVLLDFLLPPRCLACAVPHPGGLCAGCLRAATGLALTDLGKVRLGPGVTAAAAFAYDGVIRDAIRTVKVRGRHHGLAALSALLWTRLGLPDPPHSPWPVTWVPSTRRRLRRRGIEIPQTLAGPGAVALLRRVRDGPDQTVLAPAQRKANPAGAFVAVRPVSRRVVLVDDVRTTGATALAAADALRSAGAADVLVVTLAAAI